MNRAFLILGVCLLLPGLHAQAPEGLVTFEELNNEVVLKMVRERIPEDTIIALIQSNPPHFDTSVKGVEELKSGGVSKRVIAAIVEASRTKPQATRSTASPAPEVSRSTPARSPAQPGAAPPMAKKSTSQPAPNSAAGVPARVPAVTRPSATTTPSPSSSSKPLPGPRPAVASSSPSPSSPRESVSAPRPVANSPATRPPTTVSRAPSLPPRPPRTFSSESEDEAPRAEIFGGLTYSWSESGANRMGWNSAVTGNINHWFGVVADLSSRQSFENRRFLGVNVGTGDVFLMLFGPQFTARTGRIDAFARALVGRHHSGGSGVSPATWRLAYGFGGGADVRLSSRLAVRAIQWDVLSAEVNDNDSRKENRLAFGVVARF